MALTLAPSWSGLPAGPAALCLLSSITETQRQVCHPVPPSSPHHACPGPCSILSWPWEDHPVITLPLSEFPLLVTFSTALPPFAQLPLTRLPMSAWTPWHPH